MCRTIRNRGNAAGFKFCESKTKLYLTQKHRKAKFQCCKNHVHWSLGKRNKLFLAMNLGYLPEQVMIAEYLYRGELVKHSMISMSI